MLGEHSRITHCLQRPHASPELHTRTVWTAGMRVKYECDEGFEGNVVAKCGNNDSWYFEEGEGYGCTIVGCGSLDFFLTHKLSPNWTSTMRLTGNQSLTTSHSEEEVQLQCLPGYWGSPVARCIQGSWQLDGDCQVFKTSKHCTCLQRWIDCRGFFGSDCQEQFGCSSQTAEPWDWCKVVPDSCPRSARNWLGFEPQSDFCVHQNYHVPWSPKPLPDSAWASTKKFFVVATFLLLVLVMTLGFRRQASLKAAFNTRQWLQLWQRGVEACQLNSEARLPQWHQMRKQCWEACQIFKKQWPQAAVKAKQQVSRRCSEAALKLCQLSNQAIQNTKDWLAAHEGAWWADCTGQALRRSEQVSTHSRSLLTPLLASDRHPQVPEEDQGHQNPAGSTTNGGTDGIDVASLTEHLADRDSTMSGDTWTTWLPLPTLFQGK
mmetsp:Transcript_26237/g.57818  ORF Transcript_26237/g.57818 Transcript_26237/m.57818 type:complete len:433 (+) Transcript_26237:247-1545(+)